MKKKERIRKIAKQCQKTKNVESNVIKEIKVLLQLIEVEQIKQVERQADLSLPYLLEIDLKKSDFVIVIVIQDLNE